MKLYDPERPKIYHKPAFLPGHVTIPRFYVWPCQNGTIELQMMLPLEDNRFSGKYFTIYSSYEQLAQTLEEFSNDPELFVQKYFSKDPTGILPGLNPDKKPPKPLPKEKEKETLTFNLDELIEE